MKKILAFVLAMVMVFGLSISALAADEPIVIAPAPAQDLTGAVIILHTNDVHGGIEGYAKIAAAKQTYEAMGADVLLFDAGDFSQGTTYVSVSQGATAIELMNLVGYDACTLGNHEFDYGYDNIKVLEAAADFPFLAANITKDGAPAFTGHQVFTAGDLKIGVFGLETPETATKAHPAKIQGVKFLDNDELFACAQAEVNALKAEGCDLVVCLGHLGIDNESIGRRSVDLLAKVTGIDLFIDGHSHSTLEDILAITDGTGMVGDTLLTSTGTKIDNMGMVVIADGEMVTTNLATADFVIEADAAVAALADKIIADIEADFGATFAESKVTLNGAKAPNGNRDSETNNGDLITDAMLWYATKDGGLDVDADHVVALTNGGGIRAAINPGSISKNDINTVLPFGNTVAIVYVTGAELLEALEASTYCTPEAVGGFPQVAGIEFTLDTTKAFDANAETYPDSTYYGPASINRVTVDSINGKDFSLTDKYAVVTNDFCAAGGDTYYAFKVAPDVMDTGTTMDVALMEYITEELGGVIGEEYAEPQGRITVWAPQFTDVAYSAWYKDAVLWAAETGVTTGTSDTTFSPDVTLNREQAVTMIYRYIESIGKGFTGANMFPLTCADADQVSEWAYNAVRFGVMSNVLVPDENGNINPQAPITRGELAAMLYKFAALLGDDVTKTLHPDTNYLDYSELVAVNAVDPDLNAILVWAQDRGILQGDGQGNLMPFDALNRAAFVTMMYRFVG